MLVASGDSAITTRQDATLIDARSCWQCQPSISAARFVAMGAARIVRAASAAKEQATREAAKEQVAKEDRTFRATPSALPHPQDDLSTHALAGRSTSAVQAPL